MALPLIIMMIFIYIGHLGRCKSAKKH